MAGVSVFGSPAATDVARVLTCLLEKQVEFQLIRMDTYRGLPGHCVPEFIKMRDPSGQVTYKEEGKTLVDSRQICRHVADKFAERGNTKLLGPGSLERAAVEQWLQAEATNFDPPSSALVFHLAFAPLLENRGLGDAVPPDDVHVEEHERRLAAVLDVYERRLGETEYLAGDCFSLADLSHLPNAHYLMSVPGKGRELFEARTNVSRWWKDISSRPAWRMVVQMQGDYSAMLF